MRMSRKGFTLIEVMVAAAILGIGCMGVLGMLITSMRYGATNARRTEAVNIAEQIVDAVTATHYQGCPTGNANKYVLPCNSTAWTVMTHPGSCPTGDNTPACSTANYYVGDFGSTDAKPQGRNASGYQVHCRQVAGGGTTQYTPYAIRVTWNSITGKKCTQDQLNNIDNFTNSYGSGAGCDFVILPVMVRNCGV